ncbi:MAG: tRNA (N(6)-L-threonylcarbamoyladenosine(37)-C(2))-methylthiotransferase MtaB [Candidatus Enteromonas sp.]|nr:tRNA (N(6)-L-threonylcarbamoyladenosine(37)-C(2))-methylthiotransferase MtaB [Candidatus Enteromonas sp.]MDY6094374.1 tRNA (N(6)-L-threonylcarbamoyladenosine(37)-C(2))-methylthiotransferase MtaB [Candidatus Enteromonas sp.]
MKHTYFSHSLGCKVNSYETAALTTELAQRGYSPVAEVADAEVILINTCSVTARADQKSRQHISSYRKTNPNAIVVVMGCYSQSHENECLALGADIVVGASARSRLPDYLERFKTERKPIVDIKPNMRRESFEELGIQTYCENTRAYLKVQDGCNNFCSYCYIPFLRGNSRSRDPRAVVEESVRLVERGIQEIVITGIHIGAYGLDLADGSFRLADLIEAILNKCPTLPRLRISSIEESEIDDRFLSVLQQYPQIVDHLHIPLQSGSSSVLRRMKRKYDTKAFLEKLTKIRKVRPGVAITTDVIAGYPEETEEEWSETVDFCKKANFSEIHVFPFSSRPKTYAATLPDLPPEAKKARVKELMLLSREMRNRYEESFFGKELPVLFESYDSKNHLAYGHTSNYLLVKIPSDKPLDGCWKNLVYISSMVAD